MRLRFHGMYDVGELDSVLNEEDRDVVSDNVPVAFFHVKLGSKATNVAHGIL